MVAPAVNLRWRPRAGRLALTALLVGLLLAASQAGAQERRELIAVLDLEAVGASVAEGSAVTDRLREELLRTGAYTLIDRSLLNKVLNEQALQQAACTSQECAVKVGRILGVRKIVAGKLTKLSATLWQVSALMVDVESAETVRAESVIHEGEFVGLLRGGLVTMAARFHDGPAAPPPAQAQVQGAILEVSAPRNAQVFLNGTLRGTGDIRIDNLPPGSHELGVMLRGARPWKQGLFLPPGQTVKIKADVQQYTLAILPIRRTGTWKQSLDYTRSWATYGLVHAAQEAGFEVSHSPHTTFRPPHNREGVDLSSRADLLDKPWTLFGGVDDDFVLDQGRQLHADAVLLFRVSATQPTNGDWKAWLLDVKSGKWIEGAGDWPYSDQGGPTITKDVQKFLAGYLAGK